ncbi:MAG: hypothetical protein HWN51_01040 [Desulfobacterales bacterium]|nr:hypothetical protein [Desulfobacterales bacterium]
MVGKPGRSQEHEAFPFILHLIDGTKEELPPKPSGSDLTMSFIARSGEENSRHVFRAPVTTNSPGMFMKSLKQVDILFV